MNTSWKYLLGYQVAQEEAQLAGEVLGEVLSKLRYQRLVTVRRAIARKLRRWNFSLPEIGLVLGRHHTTVINLLREV